MEQDIELQENLTLKVAAALYNNVIVDFQRVVGNYQGFPRMFKRTISEPDIRTLDDCVCTLLELSMAGSVKEQEAKVYRALDTLKSNLTLEAYNTVYDRATEDTLKDRSTRFAARIIRYLGRFDNTGVQTFSLATNYCMPKDPAVLEMLGLGESTELGEQLKKIGDDRIKDGTK